MNLLKIVYCAQDEKSKMEQKWFEQYLDHFNIWDNRTFSIVSTLHII